MPVAADGLSAVAVRIFFISSCRGKGGQQSRVSTTSEPQSCGTYVELVAGLCRRARVLPGRVCVRVLVLLLAMHERAVDS